MKLISRREILKLTAAGTAMSTLGPATVFAQAPQWPTKAVSLLVGYPPGGLTDAGARHIQAGMSSSLGQPVIIENKAGAGGNLAAAEVHRATPDGYKLLVANTSFTINPAYVRVAFARPHRVHAHRHDPRVGAGLVRQRKLASRRLCRSSWPG